MSIAQIPVKLNNSAYRIIIILCFHVYETKIKQRRAQGT